MNTNGDKPIAPMIGANFMHGTGLTKREWFAGLALQGILADPDVAVNGAVMSAVVAADLLLAELEKKKGRQSESRKI